MFKMHFQPTCTNLYIGSGKTDIIYRFENGYGASVIPQVVNEFSTSEYFVDTHFEIAMIQFDGEDSSYQWHIVYGQEPIISGVKSWVAADEVQDEIRSIAAM